MSTNYNRLCQYNVFIFNNILNNQNDVELLTSTFENFNCRVKLHQSLTRTEYEIAIEEICNENFLVYEYIVIIVLDNNNPYNHLLTTSDHQNLRINNDLLVRIQQNPSLAGKPRLFIIQTHQNIADGPLEKTITHINRNTQDVINTWQGPTVRLYATGPNFRLEEHWPHPDAPVSPFVAAFCKNFEEYAPLQKSIDFIYDNILKDLEDEDFIPTLEKASEVYFGQALTPNEVRVFFEDDS